MKFAEWVEQYRDTPVMQMDVAQACRDGTSRFWLTQMRALVKRGTYAAGSTVGDLAHLIRSESGRKFRYRRRTVSQDPKSWWAAHAHDDPKGAWVADLEDRYRASIEARLRAYPDAPTVKQLFEHTTSRAENVGTHAAYAEWVARTPELEWLTTFDLAPLCTWPVPKNWLARRQRDMAEALAEMGLACPTGRVPLVMLMRETYETLSCEYGASSPQLTLARAHWRPKWVAMTPAERLRALVILDPLDLPAADLLAMTIDNVKALTHVSRQAIADAIEAARELRPVAGRARLSA